MEDYPMAAVLEARPGTAQEVDYPESDGQPMADNTKQFEWIVTIKENLDALLRDAFVAGDLFWYPVAGNNLIKQAPDVLVALGRPKGHRGSYRQWEEDNVAPQVVFEILSPGNRVIAMLKKEQFYERYGVAEYYVYDPDDNELVGWQRVAGQWQRIDTVHGWVSPLLGVRFELTPETLIISRPDGSSFETFAALMQRAATERQEKDMALAQAEAATAQAEQERQAKEAALAQAEQERQTVTALRAELERLRCQQSL
jgi:Uma2 family endonuclease